MTLKVHALLIILLISGNLFAQEAPLNHQDEIFWNLSGRHSISWDLVAESKLPHTDNIEMSGQKVSAIINYEVDEDKRVIITRDVIFPQLRTFIKSDESTWRKYRAYLRSEYGDEVTPPFIVDHRTFVVGILDSINIDGMLHFYHAASTGLKLKRTLLPSMTERMFVEKWALTNSSDTIKNLTFGDTEFQQEQEGVWGTYTRRVYNDADKRVRLEPGDTYEFGIYFTAYLIDEPEITSTWKDVFEERSAFLETMQSNLVLASPDPILNRLFYFSKIRAAESIFDTKMGLVHSPGGGRYYTGVWANDQAEYSGPFFPYLGYDTGNEAAMNAYLMFKKNIPEGDGNFWSSFEMEGELTCCGGDRGDAAMIAFGASQFALASGKKEIGEELWSLIDWSLEYCERQKNEAGVITSDSDEMEGRIPTGDANLSTSSLYYGALTNATILAESLGKPKKQIKVYKKRAEELEHAMEDYFGAEIEGLETYQYFDGHEYLRHWICLPLVMGIDDRKEGTLDALFSKLWTDNGVRVEYNPGLPEPNLFWDRGTLYAFRGAFKAGAANRGLEKLHAYSQTRLLGFHVPYVVEAWPEGNMAHLSAESALYCRIFTEGLLGITGTGFNSFTLQPHLPSGWDRLSLENVNAFGKRFDILVLRNGEKLQVKIASGKNTLFEEELKKGETIEIKL